MKQPDASWNERLSPPMTLLRILHLGRSTPCSLLAAPSQTHGVNLLFRFRREPYHNATGPTWSIRLTLRFAIRFPRSSPTGSAGFIKPPGGTPHLVQR